MRYFAYIAEQSFKTGPGGERLFYTGGPWSRPYIIPDAETEQKLFRRQLWLMRILLGALIVTAPISVIGFAGIPHLEQNPWFFFGFLAAAVAIFWLASQLVLRSVLKRLERAPAQLSLGSFYRQMSEKHSALALSLGFGGCLLFVATSAWALSIGQMSDADRDFLDGLLRALRSRLGLCAVAQAFEFSGKLMTVTARSPRASIRDG